jgi:hypothetical protein
MSTIPLSLPHSRSLTRTLAVALRHPATWLGLIVSVSSVARLAAAWSHTSPRAFPDEYLYPAIARSLVAGDGFAVRGTPAHFPALLESLVTAPLWLVGDTTTAFRLVQGAHIVAMSLAALPVYWLARRIGAPMWQGLCCAAFTVALPSLLYSSYLTADAIGYPLALGAIAAGTAALDRPARRSQFLFIIVAGLATFARVQYVIVPIAYVCAAVVLERGNIGRVVRRQRYVLGILAVAGVAVAALGPARLLGYYRGVLTFNVSPLDLAHWVGVDAMLLAYAAGIVLVPGAIVGLAHGWRPRAHGPQRAFSLLATCFLGLLLAEAALYAANGTERFQERYLMAMLPLLAVAFCAGMRLLPAGRRPMTLAAIGIALLSMRIPLSGFTELDGKQDSPFLMAVARLEQSLTIGSGSLLVAGLAAVLALGAVVTVLKPRVGIPLALAAAIAAASAASVGATSLDHDTAARFKATFADRGSWTWIDDAGLGRGSVLVLPGADRNAAEAHLFWNRSLGSVLRMQRGPSVDPYGDSPTVIGARGRLVARGATVHGPLLAEESYAQVQFDDARLVRRTPGASLWVPRGDARVAMLTVGRFLDGWLDRYAEIVVWPGNGVPREGTVRLRLSLPAGLPKAVIAVSAPGRERDVVVRSTHPVVLVFPFRADTGPIRIALRGRTAFSDGGRTVVALADPPELVPSRR